MTAAFRAESLCRGEIRARTGPGMCGHGLGTRSGGGGGGLFEGGGGGGQWAPFQSSHTAVGGDCESGWGRATDALPHRRLGYRQRRRYKRREWRSVWAWSGDTERGGEIFLRGRGAMGTIPEQPHGGRGGLSKRLGAVTGGWKCSWGWGWGRGRDLVERAPQTCGGVRWLRARQCADALVSCTLFTAAQRPTNAAKRGTAGDAPLARVTTSPYHSGIHRFADDERGAPVRTRGHMRVSTRMYMGASANVRVHSQSHSHSDSHSHSRSASKPYSPSH